MSEAHVLTDVDMARGERFELGGGEAVVLSLSKPGRDGPNEDAAAVISLGERAGVAVVSDGAGGHPGGAKAAALAVHAVCDSVMALGDELENLRGAIINGFELADRAISALGTGAAATLAVVEIQGNNMRARRDGRSCTSGHGGVGERWAQRQPALGRDCRLREERAASSGCGRAGRPRQEAHGGASRGSPLQAGSTGLRPRCGFARHEPLESV
ncbi:MAG: protein phosphatase 2C family protein [Deltaproteobacteria bacterium]|nr:protein phosphatase 2C family protein [Deltaproteobacteria bacterium]